MAIDVRQQAEQHVHAPVLPYEVRDVRHTTCCVVGGGPAGVLLALLLARRGKDARGFRTVLTDEGLQRLDEARTTHNAIIRGHFTERLSDRELRALGAIWRKVLPQFTLTRPD